MKRVEPRPLARRKPGRPCVMRRLLRSRPASSRRRRSPASRRRGRVGDDAARRASPGRGRSCRAPRAVRSRSSGWPGPRRASWLISAWISALAPTSMPRVGSSMIRMRGLGREPLGRARPSAGCRPRAARRPARARGRGCRSCVIASRGQRLLARAVDEDAARDAGRGSPSRRSRAIGHRPDQALLAAVLRHVGDAEVACASRGAARSRTGLPSMRISPAVAGVMPKIVCASSVRPGADEAGEAEDLAARAARSEMSRDRRRADEVRRPRARPRRSSARRFGNSWSMSRPTIIATSVVLGDLADRPGRRSSSPSRSTVTRSASSKISCSGG